MNQGMLTALIAVVAVAVLGLLMRRVGGGSSPGTAPPRPLDEPDEAFEDDDAEESAAVTSDGVAFIPVEDRDRLKLVTVHPPDEMAPTPAAGRQGQDELVRGDLIAARVTRGAPDHDPWRLEALDPNQEFVAWRFETEEAAREALALVMSRVVRPARDEDGEPVLFGAAHYAEARGREEAIQAELASMPDVEERTDEPPRSR